LSVLAGDLAHALDCATWGRERLGIAFDSTQDRFLRSTSKRSVLNCHRQWGKSTVMAARSLHRMIYRAPWFVVAISPSGRQSAELLRKLTGFASLIGVEGRSDGDNQISFMLAGGSRFVGLPAAEGRMRGFSSVNDLLIDEASRVTDEIYLAARPFVAASDGDLTLVSTPFGKRGFFYRAAAGDDAGRWDRVRVTAEESGRFAAEFLEEERSELGDRWYLQEYGCEFTDTSGSIFPHDVILSALQNDVEPLDL
jgi:Terminase large subunit, T4likevirus-type, N-terminal